MSLATLLVHDVTILRAGSTTDRYGDAVKDWATATSTASKAWVAQQSRTENVEGREALISEWVAFLPAGTDVAGRDRLVWGDLTFEVVGRPNTAPSPRLGGASHHVEVTLTVVEG